MSAILIAIAWANAGSGPFSVGTSVVELGVAAALTAGVAALARRNSKERARLLDSTLQRARPIPGVH